MVDARVTRPFRRRRTPAGLGAALLVALLVALALLPASAAAKPSPNSAPPPSGSATSPAVGNFTAAVNRLVELVGLAGSGLLALVWARVALSWFSNDITKKVQAKDRARDALVGTLLFTAAITGLFWGLAHWVLTGA